MKHDKITPDLAALRARAQNANKTRSPVRITKARRASPAGDRTLAAAHEFVPASPRERHDGWTPDKQVAFIDALAECACVTEACERVGLSPSTAYRLRRRVDAYSFRAPRGMPRSTMRSAACPTPPFRARCTGSRARCGSRANRSASGAIMTSG